MATTTTSNKKIYTELANQVKADLYTYSENTFTATNSSISLSVLSNDVKGAKLFSLDFKAKDESDATTMDDLAVARTTSQSDLGSEIKIVNNAVAYKPSQLFINTLQTLQKGQTLVDEFYYSVLLRDGTIAWSKATVTFNGVNDAPVVSSALKTSIDEGVTTVSVVKALQNVTDVDNAISSLQITDVPTAVNLPAGVTYDAQTKNFSFDANDPEYNGLAEGEIQTITVNYRVFDGIAKVATSITWTLTGTNDAAVITGVATGSVTEDATINTVTGQLTAEDVDGGTTADQFQAQTDITTTYGKYSISADGQWTYTLDNTKASVQALTATAGATDKFKVKAADGTEHEIVITINGADDKAVISSEPQLVNNGNFDTPITMIDWNYNQQSSSLYTQGDNGLYAGPGGSYNFGTGGFGNTATGQLISFGIGDSNSGGSIQQSISTTVGLEYQLEFQAGAFGQNAQSIKVEVLDSNQNVILTKLISYNPEYNLAKVLKNEFFTFKATTAQIIIKFTDVSSISTASDLFLDNVSVKQAFVVIEDQILTTGGKLTITDADANQSVFKQPTSLQGLYGNFGFNASTGEWTYSLDSNKVQFLAQDQLVRDTLTVQSIDGSATETIKVVIKGTNDAAIISDLGSTGTVTEDATTNTATGTLSVTDVDGGTNATKFQAQTDITTTYGKYSITADGVWTYTLDNTNTTVQSKNAGETLTDKFKVKAADGTEQEIVITINGANEVVVAADANDFDDFNAQVNGSVQNNGYAYASLSYNGKGGDDAITANLAIFIGSNVKLYGGAGNDAITIQHASATAYGGSGNDTLSVDSATNPDLVATLYGGSGLDNITGGSGNDIIIGGFDKDNLTGGGGADTFKFINVKDSTGRDTVDVITDFTVGRDKIDLTDLIASLGGGKTITFDAVSKQVVANSLVFGTFNNQTAIFMDTDGNANNGAEFILNLTGNQALTAADFVGLAAPVVASIPDPNDFDANGPSTNDTVTFTNVDVAKYTGAGNDTVTIISGGVLVYTGSGDDTITVDGAPVHAGSGNDSITVLSNGADVYGGTGNDTINLNDSSNSSGVIYTSKLDGNDTIIGFDRFDGDFIDLDGLFDSYGTFSGSRASHVNITGSNGSFNLGIDTDNNVGNGYEMNITLTGAVNGFTINSVQVGS